MRCPACRKKVVFGSIGPKAWEQVHAGVWLYSARPLPRGRLGDCPVCGSRLEWEPDEEEAGAGEPARVHLSALRDSPRDWSGREIRMRALAIQPGGEGALFLSDSWRTRPKGGAPESDDALLARLAAEQTPRVAATLSTDLARRLFGEGARTLADGSLAAWMEIEGAFSLDGGDARSVDVRRVTSIWPPKD